MMVLLLQNWVNYPQTLASYEMKPQARMCGVFAISVMNSLSVSLLLVLLLLPSFAILPVLRALRVYKHHFHMVELFGCSKNQISDCGGFSVGRGLQWKAGGKWKAPSHRNCKRDLLKALL